MKEEAIVLLGAMGVYARSYHCDSDEREKIQKRDRGYKRGGGALWVERREK